MKTATEWPSFAFSIRVTLGLSCISPRSSIQHLLGNLLIREVTEEAKQTYKQRSQIAEFPHAWIKQRCGLRQVRCRGRWKASMEATWACLSYNITGIAPDSQAAHGGIALHNRRYYHKGICRRSH
jgi:hypothetical protein